MKVLVLAPHTDDGELGCGATLVHLLKKGVEVHYIAFSSCQESLPDGVQKDILEKELLLATTELGIPSENVRVLNYQVRNFERDRQAILESMVELGKEINPDIVFSPSVHDIHQDHVTIAMECLRAYKKKTIFQYEVSWNNYTFDNQVYYCVDEDDVQRKIDAVSCYKSQAHRDYTKPEFLRAQLLTHGVQIGEKYAEVFEVPHLIIKE